MFNSRRFGAFEMRARLQKYLPIFLIALLVQILAPIGACWSAAIAASDPFSNTEICHSGGLTADRPADQGSQPAEHGNGCAFCCLVSATDPIATSTPVVLAAPYREPAHVVWQYQTPALSAIYAGAIAQARAPPFSS